MEPPTIELPEDERLQVEEAREDEFLWIELGSRPAATADGAVSGTPHSPASAPDIQAHLAQLVEERLASEHVMAALMDGNVEFSNSASDEEHDLPQPPPSSSASEKRGIEPALEPEPAPERGAAQESGAPKLSKLARKKQALSFGSPEPEPPPADEFRSKLVTRKSQLHLKLSMPGMPGAAMPFAPAPAQSVASGQD